MISSTTDYHSYHSKTYKAVANPVSSGLADRIAYHWITEINFYKRIRQWVNQTNEFTNQDEQTRPYVPPILHIYRNSFEFETLLRLIDLKKKQGREAFEDIVNRAFQKYRQICKSRRNLQDVQTCKQWPPLWTIDFEKDSVA